MIGTAMTSNLMSPVKYLLHSIRKSFRNLSRKKKTLPGYHIWKKDQA